MKSHSSCSSIVFLSLLLCLLCSACATPNPEELSERLLQSLDRGEFDALYDEGSEFLHLNVTKETFAVRAREIVDEMRKADPALNWVPEDVIGKATQVENFDGVTYVFVIRRLGTDARKVTVFANWRMGDGGPMQLNGLSAQSYLDPQTQRHFLTAGEFDSQK